MRRWLATTPQDRLYAQARYSACAGDAVAAAQLLADALAQGFNAAAVLVDPTFAGVRAAPTFAGVRAAPTFAAVKQALVQKAFVR